MTAFRVGRKDQEVKLALVSQPFDQIPGGGSVAIWTQELTERLARRHRITVFCRESDSASPSSELHPAIDYSPVSTRLDEIFVRILRRLGRQIGREDELFYRYYFGGLYYRKYIGEIADQISHGAFDVVLVMNFPQFLPILRDRNPEARIALMMHCDWLVELDSKRLDRWLPAANAFCGCSEYISSGIAKRFPARSAECHAILNGSNPERFADSPRTHEVTEGLRQDLGLENKEVILFVGRVCPEKGVHVLVEAMRVIRERRKDCVLLIVGSPAQQPPSPLWIRDRDSRFAEIERLKKGYAAHLKNLSSGLEDQIKFLGKVPYEDLPAYYGLADIFVHPAVWQEPFGMILTEAMGCGLPVVSTRAGGIPEIVLDGETGLLAEPGDPNGLAEALLELLANPEARVEMGLRGNARLREKFTWEHTAQRMEAVLVDQA